MEDSTLSPNDTVSKISTPSEIGTEIVCNTYSTNDHWENITKDNKSIWRCCHCKIKTYSINTSRTHLKGHTLKCSTSSLSMTQSKVFQQISREEMDNFQKSDQKAEEISLVIMNILEKYSINEKIFALTTNNTTTNKANSTLAMFKRYLYLHPAIHDMCSKDQSMPSCLADEELVVLSSLCQLLKSFENAMLALSEE
ncbi:7675_t:CDS:2 [Cetraspora pellucida]|uniref:7675_t:CDS:1 n=1 Tax=Cetraspora pellucida TaxID=1433469 RepID=A0A9N9IQ42_9GLOM|nr:7675_t:CDS:2 [Cetraspora pellucida]